MRNSFLVVLLTAFIGVPFGISAQSVRTNSNRFGEKVVEYRSHRRLIKKEIYLLKKRRLRLRIPSIPSYELVLHFPAGRTVTTVYRYRRMIRRETLYPSKLKKIFFYRRGRKSRKELHYPPGDGPRDGQVVRIKYGPYGKRKTVEEVTFRNNAVIRTRFDGRGRPRHRLISVPGGDTTVKEFREGRLYRKKVTTPDKKTILSFYRKDGSLRLKEDRFKEWERKLRYKSDGTVSSRFYSSGGIRVLYAPGYRKTAGLKIILPGGQAFSLQFLKDLIFEDSILKLEKRSFRLQCIPASVLKVDICTGAMTRRVLFYTNAMRRRRITWTTNASGWRCLEERFNRFQLPQYSRLTTDGGRQVTRVHHLNRIEQKTTVRGRLVRERTEFPNKSYRLVFYKNGVISRDEHHDPTSHIFKFVRIYEKGKLRWTEEYNLSGRLTLSRYGKNGKRNGLFWKKWKKK